MEAKITEKQIKVPPYISTTWDEIATVRTRFEEEKAILVLGLYDGTFVELPGLNEEQISRIFDYHSAHNEENEPSEEQQGMPGGFPFNLGGAAGQGFDPSSLMGFPLKMGPEGLEGLGMMMQHNPEQSDAPDIPSEVLEKIRAVSQIFDAEEALNLPEAEKGCNCLHCQIARAVRGEEKTENRQDDLEIVSDEDLKFRSWDVNLVSENQYDVTNRLDNSEHYRVFLGDPLGCTCGSDRCDHIKAVLES